MPTGPTPTVRLHRLGYELTVNGESQTVLARRTKRRADLVLDQLDHTLQTGAKSAQTECHAQRRWVYSISVFR